MPGALPTVGRPRDPRVEDAVRVATLELLVEEGYQATSIQAIARRAGVSAPTIYRRWANKAELIEEVVFPAPFIEPTERTGAYAATSRPIAPASSSTSAIRPCVPRSRAC